MQGTQWELEKAQLEIMTHLILDGQQWMLDPKAMFDFSVVGREDLPP